MSPPLELVLVEAAVAVIQQCQPGMSMQSMPSGASASQIVPAAVLAFLQRRVTPKQPRCNEARGLELSIISHILLFHFLPLFCDCAHYVSSLSAPHSAGTVWRFLLTSTLQAFQVLLLSKWHEILVSSCVTPPHFLMFPLKTKYDSIHPHSFVCRTF